ncbi:Sugar or nucleoside kinase, ribokinase family [Desulfocicer vacuolatum DSM 3385]|uniref:Sugar or nucleoside kinase, ribokinase family n=1 Tax=Desulfocicer vacuolatum DSM 3385 TaxID=1121400 RepID=A0A1W1ZBT6_9BACT|nr:adenosine kinase [Desulfocicer vacuolatum]SMC45847.1 Sugar or nucleoside kinase, ribokinase family [Desulfocicer vacuolatum DSM 3385]
MIEINPHKPLKGNRITGIGSALVDLLIHESDAFLTDLGKEKGGMTLVESRDIDLILEKTRQRPMVVPGGAACNTIVGVGQLGGGARFIGQRGEDEPGQIYQKALEKCRVEPVFYTSSTPTGRVLSVITPDAQRSMFTCLGASTELNPKEVTPVLFGDTAIAVIEGYLLFNPDLMMACLESATRAGALIALDLASFEVVENTRPLLEKIVGRYVDILIANEDEARAYTGHANEEMALDALAAQAPLAVLKKGARGSCLAHDGNIIEVSPKTGNPAMDTTGAGDLWAAGFLFGLAHGFSLENSGTLASLLGYEVCQVVGAHIPDAGWQRIHAFMKERELA